MNMQPATIISKRLDRRDLINALRALKDNYILVIFDDKSHQIQLKDRERAVLLWDKN